MPTPGKHRSLAEKQKAYRTRQAAERNRLLLAKGLPPLPAISSMPGVPRWKAMREAALALLCAMLAEMESYRDERSEDWQEGERGEAFEEALDQVREACDCLAAVR
jgi:hypothetical protein